MMEKQHTVKEKGTRTGDEEQMDDRMSGGQLLQCEGDRLTPGSPLHPPG